MSDTETQHSIRKMSDDERKKQIAELSKSLKEGERLVGPTRRPDGTLRKPIRIRAGYTPQDEVAIYQPKGALVRSLISSSYCYYSISLSLTLVLCS